jgi:hypothetical protein
VLSAGQLLLLLLLVLPLHRLLLVLLQRVRLLPQHVSRLFIGTELHELLQV